MGSTSEPSEMVNTFSSPFLNFAPGIFVDILTILLEKLITKHCECAFLIRPFRPLCLQCLIFIFSTLFTTVQDDGGIEHTFNVINRNHFYYIEPAVQRLVFETIQKVASSSLKSSCQLRRFPERFKNAEKRQIMFLVNFELDDISIVLVSLYGMVLP